MTLPAHNQVVNGLKVIKESSEIVTNARGYVLDSDAVGAYPSSTRTCNVSKETTFREIIDVIGVPEETFRFQNINLLSGHTNAIEYCTTMFKFPSLVELAEIFDKEKEL